MRIELLRNTLVKELKKVQSDEQLNVSDALIERIAEHLTKELSTAIKEKRFTILPSEELDL